MSDAERSTRARERLDWGGEETSPDSTSRDSDAPSVEDDASDVEAPTVDVEDDASADADADEPELCSVEDPTCDACQ